MHTRASNSELVEPLPGPERTLNQRLHRRNKRVPFNQRNNPPQNPRAVYPPILDINHFCHFLVIIENLYPMDDEPMWAADHVVALTPGSAITIPETANEFAIKALFNRFLGEIRAFSQHENESLTDAWLRMKEMLRNCHVGGIFLYKTPNQAYQLLEDKNNSDTDKIMARMDTMTIKMDAQYKELQTRAKKPMLDLDDDDIPMSCEEEAKFMQTFPIRINVPLVDVLAGMPNYGKFLKELISNKHKIEQISAAFLSDESSAVIQNKVPPKLRDPRSFLILCNFNKNFTCNALADLVANINLMPYSLYAKLSLKTLKATKMSIRLADRSFQYPVGIAKNMLVEIGKFTFLVDFIILEMEEDSKAPLIIGRPFLHTVDAIIQVKQKQLNLGVETEHMTFHM
ncbi:reverse transcriptase domain-containing protein, partial [Tanacetum coccineum]